MGTDTKNVMHLFRQHTAQPHESPTNKNFLPNGDGNEEMERLQELDVNHDEISSLSLKNKPEIRSKRSILKGYVIQVILFLSRCCIAINNLI
jgi:hypothetical protein